MAELAAPIDAGRPVGLRLDSSHLRTGHRLYTEAAALWTQVAALTAAAGESGDADSLVQAGSVLHELSRIERDAMRALGKLQAAVRGGPGRPGR